MQQRAQTSLLTSLVSFYVFNGAALVYGEEISATSSESHHNSQNKQLLTSIPMYINTLEPCSPSKHVANLFLSSRVPFTFT